MSDFSVYDAFESGLVKVVRLPDPDEHGRVYLASFCRETHKCLYQLWLRSDLRSGMAAAIRVLLGNS